MNGLIVERFARYNEHLLEHWSDRLLGVHIISTASQKVLSLLAKFSDKSFYERQVARTTGISYGSANRSLNELYATGAVRRRREGKMYFYSIDLANAGLTQYKILVNIALVEPLVAELKKAAIRLVLYGSCAQGTDTSRSDVDLFVVTTNKERAKAVLDSFSFPKGYEDLHLQPVIKTPIELLEAYEPERAFIEEVEKGMVLWDRTNNESRV